MHTYIIFRFMPRDCQDEDGSRREIIKDLTRVTTDKAEMETGSPWLEFGRISFRFT